MVFFQDEMRTGTRTELKKRWSEKGHQAICKVKIGYQFTYLYAAINPYTGDMIALFLPNMDKACFQTFANFFAKETQNLYGKKKVLIVLDGAACHQSSCFEEQQRIFMEKLPAACPELNPVERFFKEIRPQLSNQIFDTIEQVQDKLSDALQTYFNNPKALIKLCLFTYLRNIA